MIKRKQEMTVEPRFEVKGGRGGYDSTHIFPAAECDKTTLFAVNTLPPEARSACIRIPPRARPM